MPPAADVTIETDQIMLRRTVTREHDSLIATLTLQSVCDHLVQVRIADHVPGHVNQETIEIDPETTPRNWTIDDDWIIIEDIAPTDDPCRVVYGYKLSRSQCRLQLSTPMVQYTYRLDENTVDQLADDAVPRLREDTTEPSQPPTNPARSTMDRDQETDSSASDRSAATDDEVRDAIQSLTDANSG